jgi:hypothetical protein
MDGMASLFGGYGQAWKWRTPRWNGIPARPRARGGRGVRWRRVVSRNLDDEKASPSR